MQERRDGTRWESLVESNCIAVLQGDEQTGIRGLPMMGMEGGPGLTKRRRSESVEGHPVRNTWRKVPPVETGPERSIASSEASLASLVRPGESNIHTLSSQLVQLQALLSDNEQQRGQLLMQLEQNEKIGYFLVQEIRNLARNLEQEARSLESNDVAQTLTMMRRSTPPPSPSKVGSSLDPASGLRDHLVNRLGLANIVPSDSTTMGYGMSNFSRIQLRQQLLSPAHNHQQEQNVKANKSSTKMLVGRWKTDEHERFLKGLEEFGEGSWAAIAEVVKTRTIVQVRTHAQKYFKKIRAEKVESESSRANSPVDSTRSHSPSSLKE